jgi:hypothetical protein
MPFGMTLGTHLFNRSTAPAPAAPGRRRPDHPPGRAGRTRRPLGEHLVAAGAVDRLDVDAALREQRRSGGRIGEILLAGGRVPPDALRLALAQQSGLPSLVADYEAVPALPRDLAYAARAAVLSGPRGVTDAAGAALVAMTDLETAPAVAAALRGPVAPRLADPPTMDALLADAYAHGDGRAVAQALRRRRVGRRVRELLGGGLLAAGLSATLAGALLRPMTMLVVAVAVASAYWLAVGALAVLPRHAAAARRAKPAAGGDGARVDRMLPTVSLLVALHRETPATLLRIRRDLDALDYPAHKLQGLALLDPADRATRRWLRSHPLPGWMTPLVVPPEAARGRAGLLLYGLRQARGELVAVVRPDGSLAAGALRAAAERELRAGIPGPVRSGRLRRARLVGRFLREGDMAWTAALSIAAGGRSRRALEPFRSRELRGALGWDAAEGVVA